MSTIGVTTATGRSVAVRLGGFQHADGRVQGWVEFPDPGAAMVLTAAQARQSARHLIAAADECETMSGYDGGVVMSACLCWAGFALPTLALIGVWLGCRTSVKRRDNGGGSTP
jgi:hypothetical protein